jgi:D-alanyl-D-alanine carboxypeptidase
MKNRKKKIKSILMIALCLVALTIIITIGIAKAKNFNNINDDSISEAVNNGILTVVNHTKTIPSDWTVDLVQLKNNKSIDRRAYSDLQDMIDDARSEGLDPLICSAYRTQEKQQELYDNKVNYFLQQGYDETNAKSLAAEIVTYPGMSEHQLGLAADICSVSNQILDSSQEDTATQQWLMQNCYKYGFILRYPKDKVDITGISYEPWHYRYVGKEAAKEIYDKGLCLEEYVK